ncbi:GIY-YIG nuclease family protein [Burkholderia sp. LMG 21824]|uniref:GIY-YIG nuclease family protein n=1 Tax=Burkholderia sp. LMG 21824 TaxID=3158172 RepID=UPI003C2F2A59
MATPSSLRFGRPRTTCTELHPSRRNRGRLRLRDVEQGDARPSQGRLHHRHARRTCGAAQRNPCALPHGDFEYSLLVPDAHAVEQDVHLYLRKHRKGKEWFRCSNQLTIDVIKHAVGGLARDEFSRVEQERGQRPNRSKPASTGKPKSAPAPKNNFRAKL